MRFRDKLESEFTSRRARNARYSLRAFAAFLETDHSTLSQILKGSRRVPVGQIRTWSRRLGLSREEAAVYVASEHVPSAGDAAREAQLRHWTAEAMAIVTEPVHWEMIRLSRTSEFRADSRWLAKQAGATIDAVNMAFTRLLRLELIEARSTGAWSERTGLQPLTEAGFRKLALARVREKAAQSNVRLRSFRTKTKHREEQ